MNDLKCPYCGNREFVTLKQAGYANISKGIRSEPLYHETCLNCGTVVRAYIKHPEKFSKKVDKR